VPEIGDINSGVNIQDLLDSAEFGHRKRKAIDLNRVPRALVLLDERLAQNSAAALQEMVQIAVDVCGADSSGISLEEEDEKGELRFRWVAVAGSFARYLNASTPRFYSPCGTCLDRGVPQLYQVSNAYYNFLGVNAEPILEGLLIPWRGNETQGTIWLVSHRSNCAFDMGDFEFMHLLAHYVAAGLRKMDLAKKGECSTL
jgi:hypothetical protein